MRDGTGPTGNGSTAAALAAILCTRNRAGLLRDALQSLTAQTLGIEGYEVVVVDDGSTDDTRVVAEAFRTRLRLRYVYQRHSGLAAARNLGLFSTASPLVLFLDDDDVADAGLLEEHLAVHRALPDDRIAVLGLTRLAPALERDPLMRFVTDEGGFLFSYRGLAPGDLLDFSYFWGGRTSCKRRLLLTHGIFNPVFRFGCEDIELGFRLSRHGLKVVFHPAACSTMCRAIPFDDFCARVYRQGRSSFTFSRLHADDEVRRWTGVPDAIRAWPGIEPTYEAAMRSGRLLDQLAVRKTGLGLELTRDETAALHVGYRRAFESARVRGINDAKNEARDAAPAETGDRAAERPDVVVSVVIPCFNQAHFLDEAIESAAAQMDGRVDVIVVDDGSTDNTAVVAARHAGVRYIRQDRRGLPSARNAGLRAATGTYILFLDADDRLLPHAVRSGRHHLDADDGSAFCSGSHRFIDIDGQPIGDWAGPFPASDHYQHLLRGNYIGMCAAVLFRRDAVHAVGGFDERLHAGEDYDLFLRLARRFPVSAHADVVAEYRRYGGSMSDDPALMLASTIPIVRAQRRFNRRNRTRRLAIRAGLAHWREYYGSLLALRIAGRFRQSGFYTGIGSDVCCLARFAPGTGLRLAGRVIRA